MPISTILIVVIATLALIFSYARKLTQRQSDLAVLAILVITLVWHLTGRDW